MLWDTRSGTSRLLGDGYPQVAFTPDSRSFILTMSESDPQRGVVKMIDADGTERAELARVQGESVNWPMISPDGKWLAFEQGVNRIDQPNVLHIRDLEIGKAVVSFPSARKYPFRNFTFAPNGKQLAALDCHLT